MNFRFAAAILALAFAPAALFAAEGTFDKTLQVTGAATLNVSTGAGYIHITPGPDGSVHIIGHIHASHNWLGGTSPELRVRQITDHPPIVQTGNSIEVGQHTHYENVAIDYVITAPRGTDVRASAGSGDLNISNLDAPLKATTGSGTIEANDLTGNVVLNAGSGDIHALMSHADQVRAGTGSGNIQLQGVTGGLDAKTGSGDITIGGRPGSEWKLATGSGSVTLNTGTNARLTLDASVGSGDIHSDAPLTIHGKPDRHHVMGEINGGGPLVRIQTGSGDVRIH